MISLLLAFGRFAPFYPVVYAVPSLSAIRMPMKFLHPMHLSLLILFGYGLEGMRRLSMNRDQRVPGHHGRRWAAAWLAVDGFERRWFKVLLGMTSLALIFVAIYAANGQALTRYIFRQGFSHDEAFAISRFSVGEAVRFAGAAVVAGILISMLPLGGRVMGWRPATPWVLGGFLILDLSHGARPFISHYNYLRRYESNPVLDLCATRPWDGRVIARIVPDRRLLLSGTNVPAWTHLQNQWMEQQFPFSRIQTLDIWQMPRMPELDSAYLDTFRPRSTGDLTALGRLWQLTNVRRLIGPRGLEEELNQRFDPERRSFHPILDFDLRAKPQHPVEAVISLDDITAVPATPGELCVIEYGRALPRARLYHLWEVHPDAAATLARLRDPQFDPELGVVLAAEPAIRQVPSAPIVDPFPGPESTEITSWKPREIRIRTQSALPAILMINERWDPHWRARVDGQSVAVHRANHLMRAVEVPAGTHEVELRYRPPMGTLWVSVGAEVVVMAMGMFVWIAGHSRAGESSRRAAQWLAGNRHPPAPGAGRLNT